MLKHKPRLVTIAILGIFSLAIAIPHLTYLVSLSPRSDRDQVFHRLRYFTLSNLERVSPLFNWLERLDYDIHLRAHDPGQPHPDVAVVEVGEKSVRELGQFPFSRTIYRELLQKLQLAGAKVAAFDITFPERDARNETLIQLRKLRHDIEQKEGFDSRAVQILDDRIFAIDADEDFATALHQSPIPVVLGFTFAHAHRDIKLDPEIAGVFRTYDMFRRQAPEADNLFTQSGDLPVISILELTRALNAKGSIGHFNPLPDPDSVIRRIPAVLEYDGRVLAALSTRALAAYFGEEPILDGFSGLKVKGITRTPEGDIREGRLEFPLNPWGGLLVRYYGGNRVFPFYEFSDLVLGRMSEAELKQRFGGKIVFLGVTAAALKDLRATPFSLDYPGVEVHATVASNVLSQHFMLRDQRFFFLGYLFLWLFGALVSWGVYRFHPFQSALLVFGAVFSLQTIVHFVFFNRGIVVPSIVPTLSCFAVFFAGILYRYFIGEQEKRAVRAAFSRYVSSAVVEEILKDHSKIRLGGQKKELSVMFVDLVEFTKLSEHRDAAFVTQLLNEYFTRMTNILLKNQGTLDKYMGDALMCFWGAPLENPDHARLACRTALEMREELARIQFEWKEKHGISIENRIGVHTGEMSVGNMGSDQVFSYTVMGDAVNLGSRLEGVNNIYGTNVIVSADTAARAGAEFLFRPLDRVQVKGKREAVDILELVSFMPAKEPEWVHAFRTGLSHYLAGEWEDADSAFGACLTLKPGDPPSLVFKERIRDFLILEPEDWSGVWKIGSK